MNIEVMGVAAVQNTPVRVSRLSGMALSERGLAATSSLLLTIACILALTVSGQEDTCPSFGTEFPRGQETTKNGLWLNFDTPSQCTGAAVEWRICYHYTTERVEARLRVYRKNGVNSYERVVDCEVARDYRNGANIPTSCDMSNRYCCETLPICELIEIEKNDIIGVCMSDEGNQNPLFVLDESPPPGYSLYEFRDTAACSNHVFGDITNFIESDLNSVPQHYGLHTFLNITADTAACTVGSNPPPFSASTKTGLFLNMEHPSQCNGLITTWHYCYYPIREGEMSITVGVWRLNQATQQYNLIGSSRNILVIAESSFASVICGTEELMESDYMSINEKDVIGVSIPSTAPLPIVASSASGYSLKVFSDGDVTTVDSTQLQDMSSFAIHISADIMVTTPFPTPTPSLSPTPIPTAMETPDLQTSSSEINPESTQMISSNSPSPSSEISVSMSSFISSPPSTSLPSSVPGTLPTPSTTSSLQSSAPGTSLPSSIPSALPTPSTTSSLQSSAPGTSLPSSTPSALPTPSTASSLQSSAPSTSLPSSVPGTLPTPSTTSSLQSSAPGTSLPSSIPSALPTPSTTSSLQSSAPGTSLPSSIPSALPTPSTTSSLQSSALGPSSIPNTLPTQSPEAITSDDSSQSHVPSTSLTSSISGTGTSPTSTPDTITSASSSQSIALSSPVPSPETKSQILSVRSESTASSQSPSPESEPVLPTASPKQMTSSTPIPTILSPEPATSLNTGIIIGIVVAAVVILLAVAIATIIVYRKQYHRKYIFRTAGKNPGELSGIDNIIYDATEQNIRVEADSSATAGHAGAAALNTYHDAQPIRLAENSHSHKGALPVLPSVTCNPGAEQMYEMVDLTETAPEYSAIGPSVDYYSLLDQVKEDGDVKYADIDPFYSPAQQEDDLYQQIKSQGIVKLSREAIELTGFLGSGQFGNVNKGVMRTSGGMYIEVAVKTLASAEQQEHSNDDKVRFLQEAAIMAQFKHPNVVKLYGVIEDKDTIMMVVELLAKGDLCHYLKALEPEPGQMLPTYTAKIFLGFCQQVALGMQYLSGKGFVHRDLAARNILISDGNICKIGDFGMSRDLADDTYYVSHGGKVPVKWTAPEAIHFKKYSTASDVWSYGCLLYEIWSLGHKPFGSTSNMKVVPLVQSGYRLPPPPGCPKTLYIMMIQCWNPEPSHRPPFRDLLIALLETEDKILEIPSDALSTHRLAGVLGAPLEAGEKMYKDLQQTYSTAETM